MSTETYVGTLTVFPCCQCGISFGVPKDFNDRRREDHRSFYCPNGHGQSYTGESPKECELRLAKQNEQWYREYGDRKSKEAETAKRQAAAARGVVTRIKKRIGKGVCPCCKRYFADLHRHMSGQHPDYPTEVPS